MHTGARIRERQGGYALVLTLLLLVLLAVLAMAWNRRAALQLRLTAGAQSVTQRYLDHASMLDKAVWRLTQDPCWRTGSTGVVELFNGKAYVVSVTNFALAGYQDAVSVSCSLSGSTERVRSPFRYFIQTVAGQYNNPGYSGNGAAALLARIRDPGGLALDAAGNLYIADSGNHCIRKVDTAGIIRTFAGNGLLGYAGNGGLAVNASLNTPQGVAVDGNGDVFIADTGNHWVRKVDKVTGRISLYQGAFDINGVPLAGNTGPALDSPQGVSAVTSPAPMVYIADTGNHRIVRVPPEGGITVVAGTGTPGYSGDNGQATSARLDSPRGVCLAASGNLFIADSENHRIRRVAASGVITTVVGTGFAGNSGDGGLATLAKLDDPRGICVDPAENIFFVDAARNVLRVVSHQDLIIRKLAGPGGGSYDPDGTPAVNTRLDNPCGVALSMVRGGRLIYISGKHDHQVRALRLNVEPLLY